MHELSIAMSLVDVASEQASRMRDVRVTALHVRLGVLSGVVADALSFSFALAAEDSPIAGAQLVIEEAPIVVHCTTCNAERQIPSAQLLHCPICSTPATTLVGGREMELVSLEVEDLRDLVPAPDSHVAAHR
jgi:hydrogenase nickel incorporation protein HypA/HybF